MVARWGEGAAQEWPVECVTAGHGLEPLPPLGDTKFVECHRYFHAITSKAVGKVACRFYFHPCPLRSALRIANLIRHLKHRPNMLQLQLSTQLLPLHLKPH
jgi:hypothetical protein